MRNFGMYVFIVGLLLLILDPKIIDIIGILGAAFGLFALVVPDKAAEIVARFKSKKSDEK